MILYMKNIHTQKKQTYLHIQVVAGFYYFKSILLLYFS